MNKDALQLLYIFLQVDVYTAAVAVAQRAEDSAQAGKATPQDNSARKEHKTMAQRNVARKLRGPLQCNSEV